MHFKLLSTTVYNKKKRRAGPKRFRGASTCDHFSSSSFPKLAKEISVSIRYRDSKRHGGVRGIETIRERRNTGMWYTDKMGPLVYQSTTTSYPRRS